MFDFLSDFYEKPSTFEIYKTKKGKFFTYHENPYYPITTTILIGLFIIAFLIPFKLFLLSIPLFILLLTKRLFTKAFLWLLLSLPLIALVGATSLLVKFLFDKYEWLSNWWAYIVVIHPAVWVPVTLFIFFYINLLYMSKIPTWEKTKYIKNGNIKISKVSAENSDEALALAIEE